MERIPSFPICRRVRSSGLILLVANYLKMATLFMKVSVTAEGDLLRAHYKVEELLMIKRESHGWKTSLKVPKSQSYSVVCLERLHSILWTLVNVLYLSGSTSGLCQHNFAMNNDSPKEAKTSGPTAVLLDSREGRDTLDIIDKLNPQGISRHVSLPGIIVCGHQSFNKPFFVEQFLARHFPPKIIGAQGSQRSSFFDAVMSTQQVSPLFRLATSLRRRERNFALPITHQTSVAWILAKLQSKLKRRWVYQA